VSGVRNDHLGIFQGRYAFHLHTSLTDGRLTVADYFAFAVDHGIERLIFLEHIRKEPTYDVDAFMESIRRAARESGIPASIGFEAKVLPGGELDIEDDLLEQAEVVGIAEHGFPDDTDLLIESLITAFQRYGGYSGQRNVVWVHPGLALKRRKLLGSMDETYRDLIVRAWEVGLIVEHNLRYGLVPKALLTSSATDELVTGIDAHHLADLTRTFGGDGSRADRSLQDRSSR
jgi:putative hydrolase